MKSLQLKKLLQLLLFFYLPLLQLSAKENNYIVFHSNRGIGSNIQMRIYPHSSEDIITLEGIKEPYSKKNQTYTLTNQRVIIKGNIKDFTILNSAVTEIDLSHCPNLQALSLAFNEIEHLSLNKNKELKSLILNKNKIKDLNVSNLQKLEYLNVDQNLLTSLDLSQNANLSELYCKENKLSEILFAPSSLLKNIACAKNNLSELDFSNTKELCILSCYENNLKGKSMTQMINSLPKRMTEDEAYIIIINPKNKKKKETYVQY